MKYAGWRDRMNNRIIILRAHQVHEWGTPPGNIKVDSHKSRQDEDVNTFNSEYCCFRAFLTSPGIAPCCFQLTLTNRMAVGCLAMDFAAIEPLFPLRSKWT